MIQGWNNRLRSGDESARAVLLDRVCARSTWLARTMLEAHPKWP
jgi:hypothetical protein